MRIISGPCHDREQTPAAATLQISLALGFLFLGAGQQTFATSNEAVAALVVALFPRFPQSPGDQRCHLQVLLRDVSTYEVRLSLLFIAVLDRLHHAAA